MLIHMTMLQILTIEGERFNGTEEGWAENLNLMFTFRGIPCVYYGSEIEFKKR